MKQSLSRDTLAYQLGVRPALQFFNMGVVPVQVVVQRLNDYMNGDVFKALMATKPKGMPAYTDITGMPEVDALTFYMMNHAVSLIRQKKHVYEPLGAFLPVIEAYQWNLVSMSQRMFYYMLLICTRESRHAKNDYSDSVWGTLKSKYGQACFNFHKTIKGKSSDGAASVFRSAPPEMTIGNYTEFLCDLFHNGYYSSGYGGVAWGKVADVLRDFVHGKITAEMMMDTAFTLCHNNGPIFNKGMLFHSYSHEIYKILDVQRSGQIPQYVYSVSNSFVKGPVRDLFNLVRSALPDFHGAGYIDWYLVEELGALNNYKSEQQAQVKEHGFPSKFKAKMEMEKLKQEAKAKKEAAEVDQYLEVMPGIKVKKVKVPR